ncbi:MAG TPA: hypothetical protein PLO37_02355 [Candidatus Hydrogenedentes bacterium]|nr:hypothetical protein [Candidatus Hydrogenedentota bacterium]HPG65660.1 hypothetical protein [Candidatus Hydrogenedentota bacterium]
MGNHSNAKARRARLVEMLYDLIAEIVAAIILGIVGCAIVLYGLTRYGPPIYGEELGYALMLIPIFGFFVGLVILVGYRREMKRGKGTLAETKERSKRYVRK